MNGFDKDDKVTESKIELRVLELEWVRVRDVAQSPLEGKSNITTEVAIFQVRIGMPSQAA
jgi:hypothetical protein